MKILSLLILILTPVAQAQFAPFAIWQSKRSYLVQTSFPMSGNLGGRAGADTICRNDLTSNTWMGKPADLSAAKITAFLCDSGGCATLRPNSVYTFASSGWPNGGATFTTDIDGVGPNNTTAWSGSTLFDGNNLRSWTGRSAGTTSKWGTTPSGDHCNNWTSSSILSTGTNGNTNVTDSRRWNEPPPATCDSVLYLICIVDI